MFFDTSGRNDPVIVKGAPVGESEWRRQCFSGAPPPPGLGKGRFRCLVLPDHPRYLLGRWPWLRCIDPTHRSRDEGPVIGLSLELKRWRRIAGKGILSTETHIGGAP